MTIMAVPWVMSEIGSLLQGNWAALFLLAWSVLRKGRSKCRSPHLTCVQKVSSYAAACAWHVLFDRLSLWVRGIVMQS